MKRLELTALKFKKQNKKSYSSILLLNIWLPLLTASYILEEGV